MTPVGIPLVRMETRAANKTTRPGLVDVSPERNSDPESQQPAKRRRTASEAAHHKEQLAADKQAKQAEAKKIAQKKLEVAELEDTMEVEAETRKRNAARPPVLSQIVSKVSRPVAELVVQAEKAIAAVEHAAGAIVLPSHNGECKEVLACILVVFCAHFSYLIAAGGTTAEPEGREFAGDEYDDGDHERDEDYNPDNDTQRQKSVRNGTSSDGSSNEDDEGLVVAPPSPVRPQPNRGRRKVDPRTEIRAGRRVPETPADRTLVRQQLANDSQSGPVTVQSRYVPATRKTGH